MLAHPEAVLDIEQAENFFADVARRSQHWPLQYLTGEQEFYGLPFQLSQDVLIPRPETELLVEAVLGWVGRRAEHDRTQEELRIVDVGTGSGAIALALASQLPGTRIDAVDLSPPVRRIVELNAHRLKLEGQLRFVESDLLGAFEAAIQRGFRFDVVVSNPPYVPSADAATLQPEVRDFEPHLALFAGKDGLEVYRRLIPQAFDALRPGGLLALEFGFGQKDALKQLLRDWNDVSFTDDYAGIPRVALATKPPMAR